MAARDSIAVQDVIELPERQPQPEESISNEAPTIRKSTNSPEPPSPPPHQLLKLLSAAFSFFAAGANDGSLGSLIPYILSTYSISPSYISLVYLTTFLGWFLCALTSPFLTTHLSLPSLLTLGAVLQLASQTLRSLPIISLPLFAFTFFLTGLGQAIQDSFSNTFVATLNLGGTTGKSHRSLGLIHAMYGLGLLIAPFTATSIANRASPSGGNKWERVWLWLTGIDILNIMGVLYAFRDSAWRISTDGERGNGVQDDGEVEGERGNWSKWKQLLGMKNLYILALFFFFHLGVCSTSGGWVVEFLVRTRHGDLHKIGYVPSGFYGGLCLSRLILVEPTHRYGERRMLLLYSILSFAMQLVFWLVKDLATTIVMFSLMGFLMGPFFAAVGLIFLTAQAGAAIFPSLIGLIAARAGVQVLPPIVAGLIVAMGVTWGFVPRVERVHEE
ncbi:Bypass of stop codon protein [Lachnellula hyalina]|uniref:Bypass of stop codon protein n=1 Tax=Lachnellula hyalina TaxID=1316788 RepID=A0A8H8TXT0_9HELO|nr:Bypass of stop codon protein [Lachnellula hyalina]TVY23261.1 Bypass of stop codon protein [Lachnellula hyalina]